MPKLHALLIAINHYHPASGVSSLAGCINDRNAVQKLIERKYQDLDPQITTLTNHEATRKNIIKTFREQIAAKAQKGDTVLWYYAGHGSYATAAPEFQQFDGFGQDETFVCYDSRLPDNHDLTDKEIAVLLSEIKEGVHTVLIADSCHSASITRMVDFKRKPIEDKTANLTLAGKRFFNARTTSRNLDSYLLDADNYYTKLGGNIQIPRSKHLLLSACNRDEEAWETAERRGLFTTVLLEELEENQNISYRDLFVRVRTRVFNTAKNQKPTLYPYEGFNPNTVFLRPNVLPNRLRHQIVEMPNGTWRMELGAINGLPDDAASLRQMVVGIYDGIEETATLVDTSGVSNMYLAELALAKTEKLSTGKVYWGEMLSLPTFLLFNLTGRRKSIQQFLDFYTKNPSPFVQLIPKYKNTKYRLHVTKRKLSLRLQATNEEIVSIKKVNEANIKKLKKHLKHLADWENIAQLSTPNSSLVNSIDVKFLEEKSPHNFEEHSGENITIDYFKSGQDTDRNGTQKPIWYKIQVRNSSDKDLYVNLLHLNTNYGIASHYPSGLIRANSDWITLDDQHGLVIEDKAANQVTDIFKVIVSTEQFDDFKYVLEDLRTSRGVITRREVTDNEDWYAHTLRVTTIRPQGAIGNRTVTLSGITFEKHDSFAADLSLVPLETNARNIHPANGLIGVFNQENTQLLTFGEAGTRSTTRPKSIFELSNVQNTASLKDQPLVLNLSTSVAENDHVIPITMADGFIVPLGTSLNVNGKTQVQINSIPSNVDVPPSSQGKRSLGRALWFSLLKLVGLKDDAFLLRKVVYKNGLADRVRLHKTTVKRAKKILLVIHGIIGDTKTIISNLEFLQAQNHYDLIISFDYENLNTKIEDIAAILNERLSEVKLGKDDGKQLDILAHSMGGLVSRYLIEFIKKGDNTIDNLFMFGTPNGGSVFGEIPVYRDKLVKLLTVGLNFGKAWLGWIGTTLSVVNKILIGSKAVTITLAQMSTESAFIDQLKDGEKGHTQYTVIAGDISDYENIEEARLARFVEAILLKIGEKANSNLPNDIAVLVKDIRAIPDVIQALKYDVCCHHLNYFESEAGLIALQEAVLQSREG